MDNNKQIRLSFTEDIMCVHTRYDVYRADYEYNSYRFFNKCINLFVENDYVVDKYMGCRFAYTVTYPWMDEKHALIESIFSKGMPIIRLNNSEGRYNFVEEEYLNE